MKSIYWYILFQEDKYLVKEIVIVKLLVIIRSVSSIVAYIVHKKKGTEEYSSK